MKLIFFFITVVLLSCSQQDSHNTMLKVVEVAGRNEERPIIYRVKIPSSWQQQNLPYHESLTDTTKAIAEFFIIDDGEKIRITIHNFPSDSMEQRIPPMSQISRWKKQFQSLDPSTVAIEPQAFGGYYGFLLEATGLMQGVRTSILGWSLQLAPEHYQNLIYADTKTLGIRYREMRGDVTIKIIGPENLMNKHRDDIISFAHSFQLIDDIP